MNVTVTDLRIDGTMMLVILRAETPAGVREKTITASLPSGARIEDVDRIVSDAVTEWARLLQVEEEAKKKWRNKTLQVPVSPATA